LYARFAHRSMYLAITLHLLHTDTVELTCSGVALFLSTNTHHRSVVCIYISINILTT
jgi:hypothetical protein